MPMHIDPDIRFIINPLEAERPADWNRIPALMRHHRLYHSLEGILSKYREVIPEPVREEMTSAYRGRLQSQLKTGTELLLINQNFQKKGIKFLNLKGLALSQELYGNISSRLTQDIDLLIHPENTEPSLQILQDLGYSPISSEKQVDPGRFRQVKKNYTLIHPQKRVVCELHWDLFSNPRLVPDSGIWWEDPSEVVIEGQCLPVMNRENQILYLCLHGMYHEYFRLFWLRDISQWVQEMDSDWDRIYERAKAGGLERPLRVSLHLASLLFGSRDPFTELKDTLSLKRMRRHIIRRINRSRHHNTVDRLRRVFYFMELKRDLSYRSYVLQGIIKRWKIRNP